VQQPLPKRRERQVTSLKGKERTRGARNKGVTLPLSAACLREWGSQSHKLRGRGWAEVGAASRRGFLGILVIDI
jgi:hypothetical protein